MTYRCHCHRVIHPHRDPRPVDPISAPPATCPVASAARPRELGPFYACGECFGPLEVAYEFGAVTRASIEAGPQNIWRYQDLLPVPSTVRDTPNLEPGCTPLVPAHNLARELGMRALWVKDDSANPTHSFKDRVVAVALAAARELGFTTLACPSTGNLANAVAAAAARAGIRSVVLIPADLEQQKIVTTAVYGGTLVAVEGTYDDVNRVASELAGDHEDWAFVNVNVRPYYAEGSKTLGYEVAEQLGWRLPQQVVIPVASGSQLTKVDKAFGELVSLGLVDESPYKIFGAQATGCSPVSAAFKAGHDVVRPVRPDTIAKSLAIGNPADGPYVLDTVRRTGGLVEDVTDEEVVDGHPAAGPHRGHLRRDRGRGDRRDAEEAAGRRAARPGRRHRRLQHRRGAQDPRRGVAARRPGRDHPGLRRRVHGHRAGLTRRPRPGRAGGCHEPMSSIC